MSGRVLPAIGLGVLVVLAAGLVFATSILQGLGDFLVIRDPLGPADAVIAISGDGTGERAATAAALVQEGYAPWLILSGSSTGHAQGGATAEMLRHALQVGVPRERIIVEDQSESTFDNARNTLRIMQAQGMRRAIVVTSPYHTRRAARIFRAAY
ncbi:MAG: YdcF family protein, partial [bacterium]